MRRSKGLKIQSMNFIQFVFLFTCTHVDAGDLNKLNDILENVKILNFYFFLILRKLFV